MALQEEDHSLIIILLPEDINQWEMKDIAVMVMVKRLFHKLEAVEVLGHQWETPTMSLSKLQIIWSVKVHAVTIKVINKDFLIVKDHQEATMNIAVEEELVEVEVTRGLKEIMAENSATIEET